MVVHANEYLQDMPAFEGIPCEAFIVGEDSDTDWCTAEEDIYVSQNR